MKHDNTLMRTPEEATMTQSFTGIPYLEFCFYENGGDSLTVTYYWSDSKGCYDEWEYNCWQDGEEIASGVSPNGGSASITTMEHLLQDLDERIDAFADHINTYED